MSANSGPYRPSPRPRFQDLSTAAHHAVAELVEYVRELEARCLRLTAELAQARNAALNQREPIDATERPWIGDTLAPRYGAHSVTGVIHPDQRQRAVAMGDPTQVLPAIADDRPTQVMPAAREPQQRCQCSSFPMARGVDDCPNHVPGNIPVGFGEDDRATQVMPAVRDDDQPTHVMPAITGESQ